MKRPGYRHVRDAVLARIHSREWPPGGIIPPETELAAEFGVARATINRALRELAEAGLLERRRKAGTRVSLNPVRKAVLDIPVTRLEIEAKGMTHRHKLLQNSQIEAPDNLAAKMNLSRGQPLLHLKTLHLADGQPYLFEDRWINISTAPGILGAPLESISANEWLVNNVPATAGDITFSAAPATGEDAAALGVALNTALFIVDRLTWIGSTAVTKVRLAYAPGYRKTTRI